MHNNRMSFSDSWPDKFPPGKGGPVRALTLALACLLVVSACATEGHYNAKVQTWVGKTQDELTQSWGQPDTTDTRSDGRRIFLYIRLRHQPTSYGEAQRNLAASGSDGAGGETYIKCATYFVLNTDNVITEVFFHGDDCKSRSS